MIKTNKLSLQFVEGYLERHSCIESAAKEALNNLKVIHVLDKGAAESAIPLLCWAFYLKKGYGGDAFENRFTIYGFSENGNRQAHVRPVKLFKQDYETWYVMDVLGKWFKLENRFSQTTMTELLKIQLEYHKDSISLHNRGLFDLDGNLVKPEDILDNWKLNP